MPVDYWRLPFDRSRDVVVIGPPPTQPAGVFVPGVLGADWEVPWIVEDAQDSLEHLDEAHHRYLPLLLNTLLEATSPGAVLVWCVRAIRKIEGDGPVLRRAREEMVQPLAQVAACDQLTPAERLQAFDLLLWLDPSGRDASAAYESLRRSRNLACRYCAFGRWFTRATA